MTRLWRKNWKISAALLLCHNRVMERGCDGLLMNTGIAGAKDPVRMARAMRLAVEAGRLAYVSGRIPKKLYATASSPIEGMI